MPPDFNTLIPDLQGRLASTQDRLAELREARRPYALGAASGDAKAQKAIAVINARFANASAESETLAVALDEAKREKAEAEAKAAEEERLRRAAEARRIAAEIGYVDKQVDKLAKRLAKCLDNRAALIEPTWQNGRCLLRRAQWFAQAGADQGRFLGRWSRASRRSGACVGYSTTATRRGRRDPPDIVWRRAKARRPTANGLCWPKSNRTHARQASNAAAATAAPN